MPQAPDAAALLGLLVELGRALQSPLTARQRLSVILRQAAPVTRAETASLWLYEREPDQLRCLLAAGPNSDALPGLRLPVEVFSGDGRAAGLAPGTVLDLPADRLPPLQQWRPGLIAAPLLAEGHPLGFLILANRLEPGPFSDTERDLAAALAGHAAVIVHNERLSDQRHNHDGRRRLLEQISRHMQQTLEIDVLIPLILSEVNKVIEAEASSLWLVDPESGSIRCRFATGPGADALLTLAVPMGKGIVGASVARQESTLVADAQRDERLYRPADRLTGTVTRSLLCVPLVRQGRSIGAIEAVNKSGDRLFAPDDLELLSSLADSAALSIENARLYQELRASYDSTLDALTAALDLRDRETEGHSRRVVEYTARLARQIGLGAAAIAELCRGALIHDIGKIGVPDAVLHKPGEFNPDERRVMEQHARAGYEMLLGIPYLKEEIQIVLAHHEHWDGTGYPLGLRGPAIPLSARLFAIADTFDALTSDRPYRRGRAVVEAQAVIAQEAGRQFDPSLVEAFLAIPADDWQAIRDDVQRQVQERQRRQAERVRCGQTRRLTSG
jgi:HD-GYP domain-containing protein (c-di-GMP phosphodiesterase class II)